MDLPSFSTLFRIARDEVLTRNGRISRDAVEREGMDANILIAAAVAAADEVVGQVGLLAVSLFLDSARDDDLDRLVYDRYGLSRKAAAASQGSAQFSTTAPAPGTFTIPTNTPLSSSDGIQFVTTADGLYLAGSTGPLTVPIRSALAGSNQNIVAGALTSILATFVGQPSDLVVTNAYATAGGDDAETDDSLKDRARRFFTTVRAATLGALEEAALGVPGVRSATAIEVLDALGRPARSVQLIVSDAFTDQFVTFDTLPPRYQVQSQSLATTVFGDLSDVRPAGIFVNVIVGSVVLQSFQLSLAFFAGVDVNSVALQARAAIVNYVNALAPGASIVIDDPAGGPSAKAALGTVTGLNLANSSIISPAGNVDANPVQVLRTGLALVSALAEQTDQPIITGTTADSYSLATN